MKSPTRSRRLPVRTAGLFAALTAIVLVACGRQAGEGPDRTGEGSDASTSAAVPDSFLVEFETSRGRFRMALFRDWSPAAVDRVHELAQTNFYAGARFYRVNPRYAQFGYTGRPEVDSVWVAAGLPDEIPRESNVRGSVSFARGGPGTRSVILFVNRGDNTDLDQIEWRGVLGFPPVGRIDSGMEVVDALYDGYGEDPLQWEDSIAARGNDFLDRRYPLLDSIVSVRILEDWR